MRQQKMFTKANQTVKAYYTDKPVFDFAPAFADNGVIIANIGYNRRLLYRGDIYHRV